MIGVCLVTYNQEQYIAKAIESVLSQINSPYPVRIYIGNDASQDKTGEICEKYAEQFPGQICLINQEKNLGLVSNTLSVLERIRKDGCKYIAMLDGDDYWCDQEKLQKQVSFLDSHPDYGFVHTRIWLLTDKGLVKPASPFPPVGNVFDKMGSFPVGGSSAFYRTSLLDLIDMDAFPKQGFLSLDYVMYAIFSAYTLFGFLEDYTTVWRRNITSVSNPQDEAKQIAYLENDRAMWRYLGELFPQRFFFDEAAWKQYYDGRVFQIAFHFCDYDLAHRLLPDVGKDWGGRFQIKRICAQNRCFFGMWTLLKHLKASLSAFLSR